MEKKKDKFRYTVFLQQCLSIGILQDEKIVYEVLDLQNSYPYHVVSKEVTCKKCSGLEVDEADSHKVYTVLKKYIQVPCKIHGVMSSVLVDLEDMDHYILHSQLLEQIQQENARKKMASNNFSAMQYLSYGYFYQQEEMIYCYHGFLSPYERDVFCFQQTGTMFHGNMKEVSLELNNISSLLSDVKLDEPFVKKIR